MAMHARKGPKEAAINASCSQSFYGDQCFSTHSCTERQSLSRHFITFLVAVRSWVLHKYKKLWLKNLKIAFVYYEKFAFQT